MRPPGDLDELGGAGRAAWSALVGREVERILAELKRSGREPARLLAADATDVAVRTIEWPAFPIRVSDELGAAAAMELLDRSGPSEEEIGRAGQEEYAEWRLVHRDGEARGIELTTELREYWTLLAGHEPRRALEVLASFAGEDALEPVVLFGPELENPLASQVTVAQREAAFARTMLPAGERGLAPFGPHNDGRAALCCMVQASNSLAALLALALSAARPLLIEDVVTGEMRYPSGSEAIEGLRAEAVDGRNSDPLIVERLVRFVGEGRPVGIDDPLGIYIRQLQLHELAQPDGEDVPAEWVELSRGLGAGEAADGRSRAQRLRFELPEDADFSLSDLVVRRSGEKLRFGGQLAELVELCAYVRTGEAGDLPAGGEER